MPSLRARLAERGFHPKKSLGQNFLVDDRMAERIVGVADVSRETLAIEIGPGTGALTRRLARAARHVVAIELDQRLVPILNEELSGELDRVTIVNADALEVDFAEIAGRFPDAPLVYVGNLPYYITSHMIRRMLESPVRATRIVIMVQLEVAQRMVAAPGDMSLLAVSAQLYGTPEIVFRVPPSAFYPQPDVESAVVRITPQAEAPAVQPEILFKIARAGFSQRRKQLRNTLSAGLAISREAAAEVLLSSGIEPSRRAETLAIPEWIALTQTYIRHVTPRT